MSIHATNWVRSQRGLKPRPRLLLMELALRHTMDKGCFPGQARLVDCCDMSLSTVRRQLKVLERLGLIRIHRVRLHGLTKNIYVLQFHVVLTAPSKGSKKPPNAKPVEVPLGPSPDSGVAPKPPGVAAASPGLPVRPIMNHWGVRR